MLSIQLCRVWKIGQSYAKRRKIGRNGKVLLLERKKRISFCARTKSFREIFCDIRNATRRSLLIGMSVLASLFQVSEGLTTQRTHEVYAGKFPSLLLQLVVFTYLLPAWLYNCSIENFINIMHVQHTNSLSLR